MEEILSSSDEKGQPQARTTPLAALLAGRYDRGGKGKTMIKMQIDTSDLTVDLADGKPQE